MSVGKGEAGARARLFNRSRWVTLLAALGAMVCLLLLHQHVTQRLGIPGAGLLCGSGAACRALGAADTGRFLGVAWPVWGFAFYGATAILAQAVSGSGPRSARRARRVLRALSLGAVAVAFTLTAWMVTRSALCGYCLASHLITLSVATLSFGLPARVEGAASEGRGARLLSCALVFLGLMPLAGRALDASIGRARERRLQLAIDRAGAPQILDLGEREPLGGPDAPVELVVFQDYRCEHCRALVAQIEALRESRPRRFRLYEVHLPLDRACNPQASASTGACRLARGALRARRAGLRAAYAEAIDQGRDDPNVILAELGVAPERLVDPEQRRAVERSLGEDLALAARYGVERVPTFFVDGRRFEGAWGVELLEALIDRVAELR